MTSQIDNFVLMLLMAGLITGGVVIITTKILDYANKYGRTTKRK